jgi:hypothetical protein
MLVVLSAASCGGMEDVSRAADTPPMATEVNTMPGSEERATLRGSLTLDGVPLDAEFLGVRVVRDGLVAACQHTIPPVVGGRFEIDVVADVEIRGCGAPGAELLLWVFTNDAYFFTLETVSWPGAGATSTLGASFSSGTPQGAGMPVTELKGHLYGSDGSELPGGTVVEAFVGDVRCGVTSLRQGDQVERFYTLIVAGPGSVPGCIEGGTLTFRLDGEPAKETFVHDLGQGSEGHELDLTPQ